ncbi:unnamed protein product [Darwinula stevensoni]|uniref:Elongation of very long chain fatty acids protein n=1 Tax=Darwinula stevensoni TaxID=69355 RepID=A0A7R9AES8_9CRUS|nr:unnamed protein product [Darwinula stevensoni]CAG0902631.1 unnamed protein product [Darwinula stevensoni]
MDAVTRDPSTGRLNPLPPHPALQPWETRYEVDEMLEFMNSLNYVPWLAVVAYVASIYALETSMKRRPAFSLRKAMAAWNAFLALFSLFATLRMGVSFFYNVQHFGFSHCTCATGRAKEDPTAYLWTMIFSFSKILEFGDTYFILLRKQKLIFLHWYHHASVLLFTWFNTARAEEAGGWFCLMNAAVHTLMYSYYFLRAMRVSVPRELMMLITISQIAQMVMGIMLCGYVSVTKMRGLPCNMSNLILTCAILMYLSYFVLFVDFFRKTYRKSAQKRRKSSFLDGKEEIPREKNEIHVVGKLSVNGISRRKSATYSEFIQG